METLNSSELEAAKSIINIGLNSAAESLSFFMKESIAIEQIVINEVKSQLQESLKDKYAFGQNTYLLITEIIGELEGVCCLVFTEAEATCLQNTALPDDIKSNPDLFEAMKEAILLEVDNIIVASVITQFANLLKRKTHGSVPKLKIMDYPQFKEFMSINSENSAYILDFKTTFVSTKASFSPMFIWFMKTPFILDIKEYVGKQITRS